MFFVSTIGLEPTQDKLKVAAFDLDRLRRMRGYGAATVANSGSASLALILFSNFHEMTSRI